VPRAFIAKTGQKALGLLLVGAFATVVVVVLAGRRHANPNRCGSGWVSIGPRCCAEGQSVRQGRCLGTAKSCPPGFHRSRLGDQGCVFDPKRIRISSTNLSIGPNDWQSEHVAPLVATVPAFQVDATEVTYEQWMTCVVAEHCPHIDLGEGGQPVRSVTLEQARLYCAFEGGRLPTLEERMALAAGATSRRFPWGQTGLVCRRAAFGVVAGPCAENGNQPEVVGSHPDGVSPQGVFDLSGNVAELAVGADGKGWACGGSFRSQTALQLKSWACVLWSKPADDVGFRCVYD
jgi:formylglycine-generating enzyme